MSLIGYVALITCAASICAKMFLTTKVKNLEKLSGQEREILQEAKKELAAVDHKIRLLDAEKKQMEARRSSGERSILGMEASLKALQDKKEEEDTVQANQQALLAELKSKH